MPDSDPPRVGESWDEAPCGLLRLDHRGLVVTANARFLNNTGYQQADVAGKLHWPDLLTAGSRLFYETQLAPVLELDGVLEEVMLDLRGSTGQRLPALVSATRVRDHTGRPTGTRVALMTVPDRRKYEDDLRRARKVAEQATAASAEVRRRLELLVQANTALASSVDVEIALTRLAAVLVGHIADWALIYVTDPAQPDAPPRWAAAHADPARQAHLERLAEILPWYTTPNSALSKVLDTGAPVLLSEVTEEHRHGSTGSAEVLGLYRDLDISSAIVVPSAARATRVATIILVRGAQRTAFDEEDLADMTDLGARTGLVIDNLRRYDREHSDSLALQQALLTSPPPATNVQIATRYLPATEGIEVGGDWYDAFLQRDQRPVVVIGDVVGHDIRAAAAMGQLRGLIRAIGYTLSATPADVLTQADNAALGLRVDVMASALIARIEATESPYRSILRWSNAGHPHPILIGGDGEIRLLPTKPDLLLGVAPSTTTRSNHSIQVEPNDTVLLYTDGLIERPGEDIDLGVERLIGTLRNAQHLSLDELCDSVLRRHDTDRRDDIALLALRLSPPLV